MKKILKLFLKFLLLAILLSLFHLNCALYYQPKFETFQQSTYNLDVYHQLQFLKIKMHEGAATEMQRFFPEGFIFQNALYGLAWCNLIRGLPSDSEIFQEGLHEINWAIREVQSPKGKMVFRQNLPLEYGAFYTGWTSYLFANKLLAQQQQGFDSLEVQFFKNKCEQISLALENSETPFLESYDGAAWCADVSTCVATLKLHDQLFEKKYETVIQNWIEKVKQLLDPDTGLTPHSVFAKTGKTREGARGSSQSLILVFLKQIDPEFAQQQFYIYRKLFLDSRFGLPGIREYPKGKEGRGDIDSGPVILEIGGAASIVGQQTMGLFKDWETSVGLRNSIEGFGAAFTFQKKKRYIFGQLPMADAFIAWSNSTEKMPYDQNVSENWRWFFQLLSLAIVLPILFFWKKKL